MIVGVFSIFFGLLWSLYLTVKRAFNYCCDLASFEKTELKFSFDSSFFFHPEKNILHF